MKSVKKAFSIVPVSIFIFCVSIATSLAGQHGFSGKFSQGAGASGNSNHGYSHQVQVNHNSGAAGRHQAGHSMRGNHGHDGNVRMQANHGGRTAGMHGDHHVQTQAHRGFHY